MIVIDGVEREESPTGGVIADNIPLSLVETWQSKLCTNISAAGAHNQTENKSQD